MTTQQGLRHYQSEMIEGNVNTADPHRLIQMLLEGALKNIAQAKSLLDKKDAPSIAKKGSSISTAIAIVGCLQASLNMNVEGSVALQLNQLYDYIQVRLVEANAHNDASILDEATKLLLEIKSGWDGIREQALTLFTTSSEETVNKTEAG